MNKDDTLKILTEIKVCLEKLLFCQEYQFKQAGVVILYPRSESSKVTKQKKQTKHKPTNKEETRGNP